MGTIYIAYCLRCVVYIISLHIQQRPLKKTISCLYEDKTHYGGGLHICAFKKEYRSFQIVIYIKSAENRHFYYREGKNLF